jgi:hypothetical protein
MQFSDVINKSKGWDRKTPYIAENELFMNKDLTENDLVIRQINASKIMDRLVRASISNTKGPADKSGFDFETDFYGARNYWYRVALPLKFVITLYLILFFPCRIAIGILSLLSPLSQLNVVLQI